ncbi:MAG TPA: cbb3-type cytochrome c oxidase subunit I [Candidatus Thermoplasmatota archaeon]|nr:cbb3-type cytochrome c oxidase subunit I [Candidatus Thermoplasmatota archaeon]
METHTATPAWKLWLFTTDHKRIGILYMVTAFGFFILGGIAAMALRTELFTAGPTFMKQQTFNELFSIHGVTMIFLWIIPVLVGGFGNYFLPLQIGAKDMSFPRLNALSYWLYLSAASLFWIGFLLKDQAALGWTGYVPLSERVGTPGVGADLWLLGFHLVGVSSILGGVNFLVTVIKERAPGVKFKNLSLFVWSQIVTAFLIVMATPVVGTVMTLVFFDRNFGTHFFIPEGGGDPVLYQHLFWFYSHPAVYVMILPAMGIVSEVIPRFSGQPIFGYRPMVYAMAVIGFLGFTVWAHHMFTIGGIDGIYMASVPIDYQLQDTYWAVSHIHYVLFGGSVLGVFAGIYYWFPRMTGRMMDERLGRWHFWATMISLNGVFMTMHIVGILGMPRRVYDYNPELEWMNQLATYSAICLGLVQLLFFYNVAHSAFRGAIAPANPWDVQDSLEWPKVARAPSKARAPVSAAVAIAAVDRVMAPESGREGKG